MSFLEARWLALTVTSPCEITFSCVPADTTELTLVVRVSP
jgi:hypothetical protein